MYRFFFGIGALVTGLVGFGFWNHSHFTLANPTSPDNSASVITTLNSDDNASPFLFSSTTSKLSVASSSTVHVPIAVYHSIRDSSPEEPYDVRRFNISPTAFDEQMRYLHENKYHTITFAMLHEAIVYGTPLPSKPVILSFDDGWRSQYTEALPILKKYGFIATFFLYPNVIEHENYMTWDEVRALRDAGMEIGSHSKSHQYMTKQTPEEQLLEVERSKEILEEKLGVEVATFAYPFGLSDASLQAMLQDTGYTTARGLGTGVTHSPENQYDLSSYLIRNDFSDFQYFVDQTR
jgi:peptidoglycan/xylan/chitin deacetylase (PgdA/CDA1 family)